MFDCCRRFTPGVETASIDGGNTIFEVQTLNYNLYNPNGPSGTFSSLKVTLGFKLTPDDYASFTGRVDVTSIVPEPSSVALSLIGFGLLAFFFYRRHLRMA